MAQVDIVIPAFHPNGLPAAADLSSFIRAAEDLGFGGLWTIDRLFHQVPVLDCYTTLTWAAALTMRIRLGTTVLLMPLRNPAVLAREFATLDVLSSGRVTLGISLGGTEEEHATIRATHRQRTLRLEEGIEVLRRLFAEEHASYQGRFYELADATITPRPSRGSRLPILLGGSSEAALARAGRIADGWIGGTGGPPEQFAANWQQVRSAAEAAGRSPDSLHNAKMFYTWIDANVDRARAQVEHYVDPYYAGRFNVASAVYGSAAACAERLQGYVDAGAETLLLAVAGLDPHQLETISRELVPLLR